jgi:hypothetical protein
LPPRNSNDQINENITVFINNRSSPDSNSAEHTGVLNGEHLSGYDADSNIQSLIENIQLQSDFPFSKEEAKMPKQNSEVKDSVDHAKVDNDVSPAGSDSIHKVSSSVASDPIERVKTAEIGRINTFGSISDKYATEETD